MVVVVMASLYERLHCIMMIIIFTECIVVFIKTRSHFLALKMIVIKHLKLKQNYLVTCSDILVRSLLNVTSVIKHLYVLMI